MCGSFLVLSIPLTGATAEVSAFSDLDDDDPSYDAITWMQENNIVEGYEDGSFQSLNKINRAEFMKIIVESITDDAAGSDCFPDVTGEWFAKYVCYGKDVGLIDGYDDGTFQPANEINFAEASKIIANALDLDLTTISSNDPWYRTYVEPIAELSAVPTSISDLDKSIARGEMSEVIWRLKEEQTNLESLKYEELEGELIPIESCDQLKEKFLNNPPNYYWFDVEEDMAESSSDSSGLGSADYSETNIQVAGVDEADTVKNDGQYIYMISDGSIRIIEAYPADNMQEVAVINYSDNYFNPSEIYVDDDQLIVVGSQTNYDVYDFFEEDIYIPYFHQTRTATYIYDISDRSDPVLDRELEFDGSYDNSRKIDDTLYMILNKFDLSYYYYDFDLEELNIEEVLPRFYDSATGEEDYMAGCTDLKYLPRERELNYLITVAIPLDDMDGEIDKEVLIGSSENVYSSTENLYIASTNYNYDDYYYDWSNSKTLVHRFALDGGELDYEASGKVPGTILDQFSMDEHDDHFRIATTEGSVWSDPPSSNNLYVLDMDLDITGSVEGLAPGESIYSTRFMGDTGYIVTFKKVDPLFVLDLSDPSDPIVTGELKVPGYSDYLQPYGDDYLIGFGKDADDAEEEETASRNLDFAWYQGMKISLFDVSDLENPTQVDSVGIGDRGTTSELLYNHKALLFDETKGLMAFPVTLAIVDDPYASANTSGDYTYQGAYIYDFDENGFDLKGTITNYQEMEGNYWDWYDYSSQITRVIYIGDTLYTIGYGSVKASDLDTLEEQNYLELD